ncbi:class III lanthipeptide [Thermoactinomyces sp. DSM 45892]|nr:class III lanthipeptide [Thermoactinomyces sp. DSM 45892]SDY37392.1 hypothetical protein SAMN05444416_10476 [Thermoactinomyces sp. DSM 45892]
MNQVLDLQKLSQVESLKQPEIGWTPLTWTVTTALSTVSNNCK